MPKRRAVALHRAVEMAEALQAQRGRRACGRRGGDGFALRHQPGGGGQQARSLHLPGQLIQHAAGIHRKARHLGHRRLDGHAGQGPVARLEGVGLRRGAGGGRLAERRLQPEAEGLDIDRDHHLAVGRDRVLDRGQRIAAIAQQFGFQQRLFRSQRRPGKGHQPEPTDRRGAVNRLIRKRHLRPRALRTCHGGLLDVGGVRPAGRWWCSAARR